MIYWFTGQPGHGKTTLAKAMLDHLHAQGEHAFHVDGDDLRELSINEDYSREGREDNIRRAQMIAQYLQSKGQTVIVSLVAPYRALREEFKAKADVTEIYVHTTEIRGRENRHAEDYEAPETNCIRVDTTARTIDDCLGQVLDAIGMKF